MLQYVIRIPPPPQKKFACPSGKLKPQLFICLIAISTSPGLSDMPMTAYPGSYIRLGKLISVYNEIIIITCPFYSLI